MNETEWTYAVFALVIVIALIFDLGLLSKRSKKVSIKQAFFQTTFWVTLALGFFLFVLFEDGQTKGLEYISAYLMEWALSIDNIFVFILIFSYFGIAEKYSNRVLLLGYFAGNYFKSYFYYRRNCNCSEVCMGIIYFRRIFSVHRD